MTTIFAILKTLAPLVWNMIKRIFHFLAAERAIFGMFFSGLILVFTGQAWAGVVLVAKALFLLFAASFGLQLATTGVKVTMMPLIAPVEPLPKPNVPPPVIVTPSDSRDTL